MPYTPKDDEAKFNETTKRLLKSPPKPHKPKPTRKSEDQPDEKKRF